MSKQNIENEFIKMTIRLPRYKKEMLEKLISKSSYNSIAEVIRAGIDKELDLQIYKDNLDFIIKELDKLIDAKLNPFIKSQRKLDAKYVRTTAINTYLLGEVFEKVLGDEYHKEFINLLSNARKKANYYVNKDVTNMDEKDFYDFYSIGELYRNE